MIPRIFHFIWIGPATPPQELLDNVAGWKRLHPSWKVWLWSDLPRDPGPWDEVKWEPVINQRLYDNAEIFGGTNAKWACKADILRVEIVAKYGGIYLDHDVLPLKPIDPVLEGVSLCIADERAQRDTLNSPGATNGNYLLGGRPNHPAFWTAVREMEVNACRYRGRVIEATGPIYVFKQLTRHPDCVVFPWQLFCPCRPYTDWRQVKEWPAAAIANHCFVGTWYERTKNAPTPDL